MLIGVGTFNLSPKIRTEEERQARLNLALKFLRVQWTVEVIPEKQTNKAGGVVLEGVWGRGSLR